MKRFFEVLFKKRSQKDHDMIKIIRDNSDNKDFQALTQVLDKELNLRYGDLQEQYNEFNKIDSIGTVVIGYMDNKPVGCGCFKDYSSDTIEIKRMIVKHDYRGSGIAKLILSELEKWAVEKGFNKSVLETGIKQPEAIKFYIKQGYTLIENYGQYRGNPNSICMGKKILGISSCI